VALSASVVRGVNLSLKRENFSTYTPIHIFPMLDPISFKRPMKLILVTPYYVFLCEFEAGDWVNKCKTLLQILWIVCSPRVCAVASMSTKWGVSGSMAAGRIDAPVCVRTFVKRSSCLKPSKAPYNCNGTEACRI
jgi:hypothetical protein